MTQTTLPAANAAIQDLRRTSESLRMLTERLVLRPVLGHPSFTVVMITIGVGYVMRGVVTMVPGWGVDTYQIPTPYVDTVWKVGGVILPVQQLMVIVLTAALCGVLYMFFRFTRVGVAMQATSQNQLAAYYMGIPVRRVNMLIWGISAGVAAFAGILLAPATILFVMARREQGRRAFSPAELVVLAVSVIGAIVGVVALVAGWITI